MLSELSRDPLLDQELDGRHRAERVLNSEVPCARYLIGRIVKTYDHINRVVLNASAFGLRGYVDSLSPLVAMHHHDLAYVLEFF